MSGAGRPQPGHSGPQHRVILLGASNAAKGFSTILETARRLCGRPLEVFAVMGHGRSYGVSTSLLGRGLTGITQSGLWDALAERPPLPTSVLLTDVGNDLMYGVSVATIGAWVEECLARLASLAPRVVMTRLPLENLPALTPRKYFLLRSAFFPKCRLSLNELIERAIALDARVAESARRYSACLIAQRPNWYAFDPIHIRLRERAAAWREILAPWSASGFWPPLVRPAPVRALYLHSRFPERRTHFGFERRRAQPAGRLRDGTTLWLY